MSQPTRATYRTALAIVLTAGGIGIAGAQSVESEVPPEAVHLARDSSAYALPAVVQDKSLEQLNYEPEHDRFSVKFGLVIMPADYTSFEQDAPSYAQVGNQRDEFEARSLRLMARGHFELWRKWNYVASYEYKGFDQSSSADWNVTDLKVSTALGPRLGTLTFGKMKQPYAYEMVGDAANLVHHERLLSPFFTSRSVGVQLANAVLDERATWAVGFYNDWLTNDTSFADGSQDFAARLTALPVWQGEGDTYLHVAAAVRRYGGANDTLRYRGRPASNVADYFVDTGSIHGDHAWHTGLEALLNVRGWSLLAEYVRADVSTDASGSPSFDGYYVTGGWVLSGEHRPYDRKAGYARRVLPQGRWGAVELLARYGRVNLRDNSIDGGVMDGWWTGVNWWATNRFKASIGYGDIDLDKDGLVGNTKTLLSRVQWIY